MVQQQSVERPPAPDVAGPDTTGPNENGANENASSDKVRRSSSYTTLGIVGLVLAALVASLVLVALKRVAHVRELNAAAAELSSALPRVTVATARRAPPTSELTLPGNAQPIRGTGLYGRVNGYLKRWLVDIGDRVKEGQLLAEISSPDVDDQLAQARANLVLAKGNLQAAEANLELAKITFKRNLEADRSSAGSVSQLTLDQNRAEVKTTASQVATAQASIQVNEATVQQYVDLQIFEKIVAPFPGVITARSVDPGALITADNPSEARPLFYLMQTDPLRVFVNVPQTFSTTVTVGQSASVYREQVPNEQFSGRVTRTANALDPNTRTLLTQVDVPNPHDALRPGMYLQVKFVTPSAARTVLIPSAALLWRPDGTIVELLDSDHRVRYRKVESGRDYGAEVEIVTGLEGGETIIVHPGDALVEGQEVEPIPFKS
jgi:RND family efflux transporter MFP subunit